MFIWQRTPSFEAQYVPFLPEELSCEKVTHAIPSYDRHKFAIVEFKLWADIPRKLVIPEITIKAEII